jgi:alcohol dehydrogenase, propanol-preferring
MKAWQYLGQGRPLTITDVAEPIPGPGQVAISVRASGLCHADVGFIDGHLPETHLAKVPITLGHEVVGVVSALGEAVTDFAVGDPVGVMSGEAGPAFGYDGGFAPTMIAPVDQVVRAPEVLSFTKLAVGADAGMVAHRALVSVGRVTQETRLGIIGLGGLGISAAQIGVALGATTYAAELRTDLHELATSWGVRECFPDASGFNGLNLDVIADFAGFGTTTAAAVEAVAPGGRVVLVGVGAPSATVDTTLLVSKDVQLLGHHGGDRNDLLSYWKYVAEGLDPVVTEISFDEIGQGLDRLRRGEVTGRLVAVFDGN